MICYTEHITQNPTHSKAPINNKTPKDRKKLLYDFHRKYYDFINRIYGVRHHPCCDNKRQRLNKKRIQPKSTCNEIFECFIYVCVMNFVNCVRSVSWNFDSLLCVCVCIDTQNEIHWNYILQNNTRHSIQKHIQINRVWTYQDTKSAIVLPLRSLYFCLIILLHISFIYEFHCFISILHFSLFLSRLLFRYQLFLQVKQDVLQGRLPISFELAAELGAYIVQCK